MIIDQCKIGLADIDAACCAVPIANAAAARLARGLSALPGVEIVNPVDANMIFLRVSPVTKTRLEKQQFNSALRSSLEATYFAW